MLRVSAAQRFSSVDVDARVLEKGPVAFLDLPESHVHRSLDAEPLDTKRCHDAADVHGTPKRTRAHLLSISSEVAQESTSERIAGTGGIDHILQRVRSREEVIDLLLHPRKEVGAVLSIFDHHEFGAVLDQRRTDLHDSSFAGDRPALLLAHEEHLHLADHVEHVIATGSVDPVVHGVHRHKNWVAHLLQDVELERRVDVPEEHDARALPSIRENRPELLEHIEIGFERLPGVEILSVAAAPVEGHAALVLLESSDVDVVAGQRVEIIRCEVFADHCDQSRSCHGRCCHREVRG